VAGRTRRLVRRLQELTPVDELDISDRRPSRTPGILVVEPAPKSGQSRRTVIAPAG